MIRGATAAAAATLLLLTGCGSTVQVQGTLSGGAPVTSGDGLSVEPGLAGPTGGGLATSGPGTTGAVAGPIATGGAVPGSGPTAGGVSGPTAGPAAPSSVAGPASGRGFTSTTVSIGVGTSDDGNALAKSFAIKGISYEGDPNAWVKAVTDDINSRGGLAGRKIVIVKHDYNAAQLLNDPAAAHQAACATWTQDRPVAAVTLAGIGVDDNLLSCMAKTQTPVIYPGASLDYPLHYQATYQRFPFFFNLAQMVGERFDRLTVNRLVARKFFEPWDTRGAKAATVATPVKVGLLGFDDADGVKQEASRKAELQRHGLKVGSAIRCPRPLNAKISCMQSATLKFASDGITHVFGADVVFMTNANTQAYYPRYFIAVQAGLFAQNAPSRQLSGAMSEGYVPFYDVAASEYPGDPTAATTRCKAVMKKAGQASVDPATLALQMAVCDEMYFLEAAASSSKSLTAAGLRSGLESLGGKVESALTWKSFLSPGDHASALVLRDLVFRNDTKRFVYISKTNYGL